MRRFTGADDLLVRRICGKRGQIADLASALEMCENTLAKQLRRLQEQGHPVVIIDHPIRGKLYAYERRPRTCRKRGCRTRLSRYNHSDYCSLHQPEEDLPQQWFLMPNSYPEGER